MVKYLAHDRQLIARQILLTARDIILYRIIQYNNINNINNNRYLISYIISVAEPPLFWAAQAPVFFYKFILYTFILGMFKEEKTVFLCVFIT